VRFVYWFVTLLVAVPIVDFSVSNLDPVVVGFWPLDSIETRLCVVVLMALLIGFFAGMLVAWINGHGWRRETRQRGRRILALERELAATRVPPPTTEVVRSPLGAARHD
jgi:uncharacterized integral membrane protein